MFVLDTDVVSELRKARHGRADPHVVDWADAVDAAVLFISAITVLELETGVLQMERRDAQQGAALRRWLDDQVLVEFADRVLAVDTAVARRCAGLHVPDPRAEREALIAATARARHDRGHPQHRRLHHYRRAAPQPVAPLAQSAWRLKGNVSSGWKSAAGMERTSRILLTSTRSSQSVLPVAHVRLARSASWAAQG